MVCVMGTSSVCIAGVVTPKKGGKRRGGNKGGDNVLTVTCLKSCILFESEPTLRRNMSPPSSGLKSKTIKKLLAAYFMLVSCLAHSSTLKLEATYSSET
jgi:hypothetical protein